MRTSFVLAVVFAFGVAGCEKEAAKPAPKVEAASKPAQAAPSTDASTASLASTRFAGVAMLAPGDTFQQRFKVNRPGIKGVSFQVVTFDKTPSPYRVDWKLSSLGKGELARGVIDTERATDWATIDVKLSAAPANDETEFELAFAVAPGKSVPAPLALPLFHPLDPGSPSPVTPINAAGPVLGLKVQF